MDNVVGVVVTICIIFVCCGWIGSCVVVAFIDHFILGSVFGVVVTGCVIVIGRLIFIVFSFAVIIGLECVKSVGLFFGYGRAFIRRCFV